MNRKKISAVLRVKEKIDLWYESVQLLEEEDGAAANELTDRVIRDIRKEADSLGYWTCIMN